MVKKTMALSAAAMLALGVGCNGDPVIEPNIAMESMMKEIVTFGTVTTVFALPEKQEHWPAGILAGVGFQPDENADDGTIAPGKPLLLTQEIPGDERVRLTKLLQPGHRAWIRADDVGEAYAVTEIEVIPFARASAIPAKAVAVDVSIEFVEVGAWHNRMPPSTDKRHLVLNLHVNNESKDDRVVRIRRVFYSFDKAHEGAATDEPLTFIDSATGMPGSATRHSATGEAAADWTLRATDAYPDGHENEEMFITLVLAVGDEQVVIRSAGAIQVAY